MALLWLLAIVGIVFFVRWLNRFLKSNFSLASDIQLLILIAFTGAITLGTLTFLLDMNARVSGSTGGDAPKTHQEQEETTPLEAILQEHYPALHNTRIAVKQRIRDLNTFFRKVREWANNSPKQAQFLQDIVDIRWDSYEALRQADQSVDLSLRQFWIHYQTGQKEYVIRKFATEAEDLLDRLKSAQAFDNTAGNAEQQEINALLKQAVRQLKYEDIPKDPKKPSQQIRFQPYSDANRQMLADWLDSQGEQSLSIKLAELRSNHARIEDTLQELTNYLSLEENRELLEPMRPTIRQWQNVRHYNQYAEYQILYAIEVAYLLDKLVREDTAPNAKVRWTAVNTRELYEQLLEHAPKIVQRAYDRRLNDIEQSYEPIQPEKHKKP